MPEEFKAGCQRPPIKKPVEEQAIVNEVSVKEENQKVQKLLHQAGNRANKLLNRARIW